MEVEGYGWARFRSYAVSQDPESPDLNLEAAAACRPVVPGYNRGFQAEGELGMPDSWKTGSVVSEKQLFVC